MCVLCVVFCVVYVLCGEYVVYGCLCAIYFACYFLLSVVCVVYFLCVLCVGCECCMCLFEPFDTGSTALNNSKLLQFNPFHGFDQNSCSGPSYF